MTEEWERYRRTQAEAWLRDVAKLEPRVKALANEIAAQRMLAEGVRAIQYDGMPKAKGSTGDALENAVVRIAELVEELEAEMAEYKERYREAYDAVLRLDSGAKIDAVYCRCLRRMTWSETAREMGYSETQAREICSRALVVLYDHVPARYRDPIQPAL